MTERKKEKQDEQDERMLKIIRSLARSAGAILFVLMLVSAIAQGGMDRLINLTGEETIVFVCIITMFFGFIWAHQNEIAGGVLIIVAYIVMAIVMKSAIPGAIYPAFFITGVLNIYAGITQNRLNRHA